MNTEKYLIDLLIYPRLFKEYELKDTEQKRRISELKVATQTIRANRELFEEISKRFFEERKKLEKMAIESLDVAIENGDDSLAEVSLSLLEAIYSEKLPERRDYL